MLKFIQGHLKTNTHSACVLCLLAVILGSTTINAQVKVLIIDGFSNHSVKKTTQKLLDIIATDASFESSVSTMPVYKSKEWVSWNPRFSKYQVVIQTTNDIRSKDKWPEHVKKELENFVKGGGGLYIYHSANNAFKDWPEYNDMIGMGWRKKDFGKAIQIVDNQVVVIPAGTGKGTSHGKRFDAVFYRFGNHPIHTNLPEQWKSADVEVYSYTRGPINNLTVLSYAYEPKTQLDFPTEWVVNYGAGRTSVSTYGHYFEKQDNPPAVRDVAFQTIFMRALQWLAGVPVSQWVPQNFPSAATISLQDLPPIRRIQ